MKLDPEIKQAVDRVQVINTHEHQEEESERLQRTMDFFSLFQHYSNDDLISAGLSKDDYELCTRDDTPQEEKWRLIEPHLLACKHTGYVQAVLRTIRDLYGVEELSRSTYRTVTDRMRERNKPGVVRWILRDKCNIRVSQVNALERSFFRLNTDPELFMQDLSLASLLNWPPPVENLGKETGIEIKSLKSYDDAIGKLFEKYAPLADAIKQQSAYWRKQDFDDVPETDAARIFEAALKNPKSVPANEIKALQDWAFHRCIRHSIEYDLPIKIHTGYAAGHNSMNLYNLGPAALHTVLRKYPKARFDLFHIGYPYQDEIIALAKHYANVYLDMCWAWIIDPLASRRFLKQCLVAVPSNKVFGFGGDYKFADPVYGHLHIARDGIARALTELVDDDVLDVNEAVAVAHRILHDNAAVFFKVDAKVEALRRVQGRPA